MVYQNIFQYVTIEIISNKIRIPRLNINEIDSRRNILEYVNNSI